MFRKMMLTAAVALMLLPVMASAQSTVTATATVSPTAVLTGSGDLAFGPLSDVTDNEILATSGASRTVTFNHNIDVSFNNVPAALTGAGANLPIQLMCASQPDGGPWSTPADCTTAVLPLDVGTALTMATLGFGGIILAADVANAPAGDYSATFDIIIAAR